MGLRDDSPERGWYLQQYGTNQRIDGPGARVAHALETPEHKPALREDGEEVKHDGSGRRLEAETGAGNSGRVRRRFLLRQARDTSHQQLPETGSAALPLRASVVPPLPPRSGRAQ